MCKLDNLRLFIFEQTELIHPIVCRPQNRLRRKWVGAARDRFYKTPFRPKNFSENFSSSCCGQISTQKQHKYTN
jgi:hypothetical protein